MSAQGVKTSETRTAKTRKKKQLSKQMFAQRWGQGQHRPAENRYQSKDRTLKQVEVEYLRK
jgi:hypothetical protein